MRPSSLEHDEHEEAICAALQVVIRRFRIRQDAQDDLTQDVWLRILSSPTIIQSFSGKSSLETYLVSVVSNMFRTAEQKRLGRWRASAQARRLGRPAIELERAITRDGVRPSEAIEQHCHNTGASR
jgi:DNA-directed RNA polymerase specialized sigma24 family protein